MGINKGNLVKGTTQTHEGTNNPPMGSVTTSFLLSMDDMLSSSVDSFETFAPLLWFNSREERVSSGKSAGDFKASATLAHSLLELHIPTDSYMPTLRQALRDNTNIVEVKIVRVGHTDGSSNTELYSSTFGDCKLDGIEESPDKLILYVRIFTRADEAIAVDTTGASGEGNTASSWDYSTNASTAS
ncbi:MAG: hypothetical protein ACOH2E_01000 [Candidatus Paracaedibacter sp.]|jgi:hypothetical protein